MNLKKSYPNHLYNRLYFLKRNQFDVKFWVKKMDKDKSLQENHEIEINFKD